MVPNCVNVGLKYTCFVTKLIGNPISKYRKICSSLLYKSVSGLLDAKANRRRERANDLSTGHAVTKLYSFVVVTGRITGCLVHL
jgi:hypothetical protein